jgi:hypothetical protein
VGVGLVGGCWVVKWVLGNGGAGSCRWVLLLLIGRVFLDAGVAAAVRSCDARLQNCSMQAPGCWAQPSRSAPSLLTAACYIPPCRPDLKLLISSATLDAEKFSEYFDFAPIFR